MSLTSWAEPRPDVRVASRGFHGSLIQVHIAAEGKASWITEVGRKLNVFHDHPAASLRCLHHTLQGCLGFREVRQQKPAVHEVVGWGRSKLRDVLGSKDGWQFVLGRSAAGEFQAVLVPVNAHGLSGGADSKDEFERDSPVAAADIQTAHPGADADLLQKRLGRRPFDTSQELQALRRWIAAQEDVAVITLRLIHFVTRTLGRTILTHSMVPGRYIPDNRTHGQAVGKVLLG